MEDLGFLSIKSIFIQDNEVYFAKDGETLIILLAGGTKKGQQKDIDTAKSLWQLYKKLKRER